MLKAFYDVVRKENVERVSVEYSISHALFIRAKGAFTLGQELLNQVEGRMRAISEQAVPIRKESINTDGAVELFREHKCTTRRSCSAFGSIPMSIFIFWMSFQIIFTATWFLIRGI